MYVTKKLRPALDYLGPDYSTEFIDGELCIYRDLGNGFDIEISGFKAKGIRKVCNYICVWQIRPYKTSVEYVYDLPSLAAMKCELDRLVAKWGPPA